MGQRGWGCVREVGGAVPRGVGAGGGNLWRDGGAGSPVQFARAVLQRLELADERKLEAYEGVFHRADPAAYATLVG